MTLAFYQIGWRIIGFNNDNYNLNLIRNYLLEQIGKSEIISLGGDVKPIKDHEIFVARKKKVCMFLITDRFKFLDISLKRFGTWHELRKMV